jgi:pyruvate dehydrogenase E1 component beta subunit
VNSVKKTGRLVVVEPECKTCGVGSEIAAIISEEAIDHLDAPIRRVAVRDSPIPCSPPLEKTLIPTEDDIVKAVSEIV